VNVPREIAARIDRDDLSEAVGNLIENAARHAQHSVSVTGNVESEFISINIVDDGPGIVESRHAEVLSRGGRLDERGSGAGLGLAIVTDIVESWGGTLALENAMPGLRATIRLPVSGQT
jgi:signal transduction histidine kinase